MTKKEVKQTKTEIIDKCIQTVEYAIVPVTTIAMIWGFDIGLYISAFSGMLVSILSFVKLFIK